MTNKGFSKLGLWLLDRATDASPSFGPKVFQRAFVGLFGSRTISNIIIQKYRKQWAAVSGALLEQQPGTPTPKILLVVDVCIGDSVLAAECLPSIRDSFPHAEIHYACNETGGSLIEGMPGVHVHNVIQGARGFPTEHDLDRLRALVSREKFSVVLNLGPFLDKKVLGHYAPMIQLYVPLAAFVLCAWKQDKIRHISHLSRKFVAEFVGNNNLRDSAFVTRNATTGAANKNSVYLSSEAIMSARVFLNSRGLRQGTGIVFFNPDATSKFGQIPFAIQAKLLREIVALKQVSAILIGRAYSSPDIERSLIALLPDTSREKVHVVPHIPIETYTALIDASDMFISGDTGPLHIASCRKLAANGQSLRNRTAIVAIYGATDSRMYGYDSEQPYHVPANQDVPSRSFSAPVPCRNITCVNKFGKSCAEVRCFDNLPVDEIFEYIATHLKMLSGEWIPLLVDQDRSTRENIQEPNIITRTPEREYAY